MRTRERTLEEEDEEEDEEETKGKPRKEGTDNRPTDQQLTKEEVGDLLEGHLVRATQLLQIFRAM